MKTPRVCNCRACSQNRKSTDYREALESIANMPPGSKGAYGKFADAQALARGALGKWNKRNPTPVDACGGS